MKSEKIYSGFEKNTRRRRLPHGAYLPGRGQGLPVLARRGAERPGRRRQPACVPTSSQIRSIVVDRNCKAAEPPSAPAPCRSGVRGRSAPAAGGNLRAYRPAHKPNRRFGRGARTVCCADAQKDRAPEGARIPLSTTLTARILTMFAAPINPCLSELQGGRPFDRSAAFAASLTPCKAPQLCCGFLRRGFARVGLRRCLKLRQGAPRPLEPRQGRMALNPVAQALPTGVL